MIIKKEILPEGLKARTGCPMEPKYITIHNTGNSNPGANAAGHSRYLQGGNSGSTGWHFTIDDKEIIQHIPANEVVYHAGDGKDGPGNTTSIGIEICQNKDGDLEKAISNAVFLIRQLMEQYNIPLENVVPHRRWSGKYCPEKILPRWDEFIDTVAGIYTVKPGDTLGQIASRFNIGLADFIKLNKVSNPDIVAVGTRLNVLMPMTSTQIPATDPLVGVPDWARGAVLKAYQKGYITEPQGDVTFYRLLVLLDRLEVLK
ncbi:N-acetylmuramoyl-L-alanine amidase [Desulfotomaculum arcticum]|uniref:N-acetylmuramoyl-L-alanine amidase n=1 Tax=Desulfotruncus arcticus DSM 17038 TaxID=1121424 RepID=A0A1I2YAU2_9FIRM|nr:N-acetylmuramoyl-L-alanine amidase [Desulfotruncus arcticus]SFH22844.1 N-acetylmuramoyl-L-alanine amidase [Desulfotomaculum arcticum] [Desulfotruncus arcticus DSM 17038]